MRYYPILSEAAKGFNQPSNYFLIGILGAVLTGALMYKHYKRDSDKLSPSAIGTTVRGGLEEKMKGAECLIVDKPSPDNTSRR